jgi:diguanylate cyclase (GGDEF)-like protein/PAS domain S-box-containing protein
MSEASAGTATVAGETDNIRRVALVGGIVMAALGCAVIAGWWLDLDRVTTVVDGFTPMKPNAALGVATAGFGIATLARAQRPRRTRTAAWIAAVFLIVLGGLTLLQVITSTDLRLDRILLPSGADADAQHPGRMATMAASSLVATGGGLIMLLRDRAGWMHVLAFAASSIGYVGLLGYLYGVSQLYEVDAYSGMAVHMAGAACAMGLGLELCSPDHKLGTLLRDKGGAGRITRTLIPTIAVVVPLAGWAFLRGQLLGWYPAAFTAAVIVATVGILGSALTLRAAVAALRSDERRDSALRALQSLTASLEQSEQRWRLTIENSPIGIALSRLDGKWLRVNAAFCRIVGLSEPELLRRTFQDLTHPADLDAEFAQRADLLAGRLDSFTLEQRYRHARGHDVWVRHWVSVVWDENDEPLHLISQIEDVSERRAHTERLAELATQDPLTGLANRTVFLERLEAAAAPAGGQPQPPFGVVYIDVDNFKQINDTLGHIAGDELLSACARRLTSAVRLSDTTARLGGDEFALLLSPLRNRAEADEIARRMLADLTVPYRIADTTVQTSVSIGVALHAEDEPGERTLAAADEAMYRAKQSGKARYVILT